MTIDHAISSRGITEALHFTTNKGLLGILHTGALKSRARVHEEEVLEYILQLNSAIRRDEAWLDYVNLSISRINAGFFEISSGNWHRGKDLWWCILAFSSEILAHDGVYFSTTNNIYTGVMRAPGAKGLENIFAEKVIRWTGNVAIRNSRTPPSCPTCTQAELLYPQQVSTRYLKTIYVRRPEEQDEVSGQLAVTNHQNVSVVVNPRVFEIQNP